MSTNEHQTQEKTMGIVKWFNNRSGFGFIRVIQGPRIDEDVFVHHSSLKTNNDQYRYLVEGEYVDFQFVETTENTHKWKADKVTGVCGGLLMCETRKNSIRENALRKGKGKDNDTK